VLPLHGSLDADAQDLALRPSPRRRVIVATNIAETSLTVPGVTAVVDSGLHKVARYDADRGIDSLETERYHGGRRRSARGPRRPDSRPAWFGGSGTRAIVFARAASRRSTASTSRARRWM
jgi:hypothetical protein